MLKIDFLPDAVCTIEPENLKVQTFNKRFKCSVSSIASGLPFLDNFIGKEDHARFRVAISKVCASKSGSEACETSAEVQASSDSDSSFTIIRDCDTLTSASRYVIFASQTKIAP
jgi:hypothetical protein